jgi:ABC-type transport system substrate-binding protein
MREQASTNDANKRKLLFDRVQEIARQQEPFIYLVHKNALSAVSWKVRGAEPVVLSPHTYWQIERMSLSTEQASK